MSWDLAAIRETRRSAGLWRELRTLETAPGMMVEWEGRRLINFASNDYLGLKSSPALAAALKEGVDLYGAGSGASRLVSGSLSPHSDFESALASFKHTESAITFTSGFAAALGTLPALVGGGDTILLDKLSHASLVDAARLSGAKLRVFPHNHLGKLEKLLETASGRVLIVTEAIFSMDGDACALAEIIALKERFGAWLLLDEAHSVGVLGPQGRGLAAALGLESQIEIHMGTLSKSFGLSGGYIAASRLVVEHLINHARSLIYSTAPPPCLAHAALAALNIIAGEEGESRRQCLRQHVQQLMPDKPMVSAILPKIIGDEKAALEASARLRELGFLIPAIRYPTVAKGSARLRITPTAGHSAEQVQRLIEALQQL